MEYCEYCREKRSIIELDEDMRICPHSPNGGHYFVIEGYEAGYHFGYKMLRTFFRKPQGIWGIVWRVAVVLLILALALSIA